MSGNDRPELRAYRELEALVHNLGDELAAFRKRALSAESQLKDGTASSGKGLEPSSGRVAELETENHELQTRLARAEDRVRQMLDRVKFLRQQLQAQSTLGAGRS